MAADGVRAGMSGQSGTELVDEGHVIVIADVVRGRDDHRLCSCETCVKGKPNATLIRGFNQREEERDENCEKINQLQTQTLLARLAGKRWGTSFFLSLLRASYTLCSLVLSIESRPAPFIHGFSWRRTQP